MTYEAGSDYVTGSHPLILEARECVARLRLRGDAEQLANKLDDMLLLHGWHGGQQQKVINLLDQAAAL